MESYILTKTMHLGHLKETFGRGAVITFNPETRRITVDGRSFDDYRDLEVLKRRTQTKPHDPWIVPYSEEVLQDIRGGFTDASEAIPKRAPNSEGMEIVQSDEDSHETIDISNTKVAQHNQEKREAQRQKVKDEGMEVINGDETAEERIARLKEAKASDLAARAERVRLMSEKKADMPIVHDDSLGSIGGSKSSALNAGSIVGGKRADQTPEQVASAAAARKAEIEANRRKVAAEMGVDPDQAGIDEATPSPEPAEAAPVAAETEPAFAEADKDAEIAALKAKLAEYEAVEKTDKPVAKTPVVSTEA